MKPTVKLINGEEALKILSEQAPVGACIMQDGRFCYVNPFFLSATGYTADELVGEDSLEIVVPEDRDMVRDNTIKMLKGEIVSPYQFRVACKDGTIIWVMATVKSIQYHGKRAVLGNYMEITERRLMEEAVKQSEERYKELANSITDVFFAMDGHLRYTYWNKASETLTGIRAEDAIGKSIGEIFPDTTGTRRSEMVYRGVLRTQQPQTFVNHYDINGRHYIFEINAYPSQSGISVYVRDISERKRTEETLKHSEERYRTILDEMEEGYYEVDIAGNFTFVNDAMCCILGYSRDELIGMNYKTYTPKEDVKTIFEAYNRVYRMGEPLTWFPMVEVRRDGTRLYVEDSVFPIKNDTGEVIGFRGVSRDVTGRKRAEEALRQSEERYRSILEEMEDSYFEVDLGGHLTFVNNAVCRDLGYSTEELVGKSYEVFTVEEDIESVFQVFNEVHRTGVPNKGFAWKTVRKDGTHGFVETSISLLRNDKGETIGFRGVGRDISERKKIEETLRQSEEKYRTILEETGDGYFETDLAGNFRFVNDAQTRLLGYSREEVIGANFRAFTPEGRVNVVLEAYNGLYKTGEPLRNFVDEVIRKDGSHGFAETTVFPIRNDRGEIVGFRGVRRDITARKQMEEALRHSEERYRTILEEMEDSYFEVDLGGHLTFVNNSVCRDLGYSREELTGKSYKVFTVEEDIEAVFRVFNGVYRTSVPNKGFPWRTVRKDGTQGFAETSISLLKNDKGETIGFRGVGRDITDRKQTEEKLRQSEENYRVLFDSSVIGTIVLDAETMKVVMANQAAARILEFGSVGQGIGLNPVDFIAREDKERVLEVIVKEMFEKDSRMPNEFRAVTKNGREIWISGTGARIMHEGRVAGLISFMDITGQKLQNERFIMTDRLASLGELASGAAHELNNPLTSIIGFSQLLMERKVPDDIHEDLRLINTEAQRAASVTRNLLTFAGRHAPMKEPNQINNIIEDVLRITAYNHKAKGIEIERQFAPDLPEVMVDYFQMQQVFMNIIINAEYFMVNAHNRGTLSITTMERNDVVMILFTDDGPGIAPEDLRRIFDPFFTTKEAGKGTGLGLSICHGIVTEHDGQIYARSQLGKGATIVVELPVHDRPPY
jgi:PAS domain S-box-containing protein